jgi:hypothetical protein
MRLVREQRESGLTVRAWCAAHSITESNFYYFLREIRKAALQIYEGKQPEAEQALVRVDLPGSTNSILGNTPATAIRMQYKNAMLDIPSGIKAEDLTIVLKALDAV